MAVTNPTHRKLPKTTTYMENMSFDPTYEVLTRIPLTLNPVSNALERPTAIQGNASYTLTYDGDGNLITLVKATSERSYTKDFTWVGSRLTEITAWY